MIEENEFKKLTANSRDWLIYQLLSEKSQEVVKKELTSEHVSGVNIEIRGEKEVEDNVHGSRTGESVRTSSVATNSKPPNPKGETTVEETVTEIMIDAINTATTKTEDKTFANWALPKTGSFLWFKMSNEEGKMRKCENRGCDLFLKYNNDKKTYEHWKLDANTGKGFFVNERCEGEYVG